MIFVISITIRKNPNEVLPIKHEECEEWLLKIHYAKRIPLIMHSFGLYVDKKLDGIITYGCLHHQLYVLVFVVKIIDT